MNKDKDLKNLTLMSLNEIYNAEIENNSLMKKNNTLTNTIKEATYDLKKVNTSNYTVKVNSIEDSYFSVENRDDKVYYIYKFIAIVEFKKDDISIKKNISSEAIFLKTDKENSLQFPDDFQKKISDVIVELKKENNEEVPVELDSNSLVYTNKTFKFSLNYPESYTYIQNEGYQNDEGKYLTLTFYLTDDKTTDYIRIYLQQNKISNKNTLINEHKSKGYTVLQDNYKINNDINFTLMTQDFKSNGNVSTENIYILNNDIDDIGSIIITTRLLSDNDDKTKKDIEEMLKSLSINQK